MGENENIVYLPYGQNEISQQDLMTSLSDGIESYLGSKKWARKQKYRDAWLNAYQDIMSQGITGATNNSGLWTITHKGNIDIDSKSAIEKEMYGDAAYYIQQKMAGLTPRSKKEEEDKNKKKENYGNFSGRFSKYIIDNNFGGEESLFSDKNEGWNTLDARGEKGLRGNTNRKDRVLKALDALKKDLDNNEYDFEGTPYKDKADLIGRIQKAEEVLTNDNPNDDSPALNALGFSYGQWFNNGGNDQYTTEGFTGTYNDYYNKYLPEQQKLQEQAKRDKLANQYSVNDVFHYGQGMQGLQLTPEEQKDYLGFAQGVVANPNRSQEDLQKLLGIFQFAARNNGLQNLSKEELEKFGKFVGYRNPTRLKKIPNLEGVYYDAIMRRLVIPKIEGEVADLQTLYNQNDPKILEIKKQEQANNRKLSDGFQTEDYLRMGAMAQDIAGAVAAWIPTYGTAASGILGTTSMATNLAADWNDDSVTWTEMLKNAGINTILAGVGMVPGLGVAAKSGKWLANIAKWTPRILTLAQAGHIALSDDIKNSLKKASSISDWDQLTNQDVKNISYALSTVAGLSRGAKGIVNNRKYKPTITQNAEKKSFITTKSGKQIEATKEQVKAINKAGRKGGNAEANKELRKLHEAENEEVNITFKTGLKGKVDPTNRIKLEWDTKNVGQTPEVQRYSRALSIQNARIKAQNPILSKFLPTEYDIYHGAANLNFPKLDIVNRLKQTWNPVSNRSFKGKPKTGTSSSQNKTTSQSQTQQVQTKVPHSKNEIRTDWKNTIEKKHFTTNEIKSGTYTLNNPKNSAFNVEFKVSDIDSNGFRTLIINGTKPFKFKTQRQLQERIAKAMSSYRASVNNSKSKAGINHKEIGKILTELKAKGWLKQGGTIDLDTTVREFFKNNNI